MLPQGFHIKLKKLIIRTIYEKRKEKKSTYVISQSVELHDSLGLDRAEGRSINQSMELDESLGQQG